MTTAAKSVNPDTLNREIFVENVKIPFLVALSVKATLCALNAWVNFCK